MKRYIRPVAATERSLTAMEKIPKSILKKASALYRAKAKAITKRDGFVWTNSNAFELGSYADELEVRFGHAELGQYLVNNPDLN